MRHFSYWSFLKIIVNKAVSLDPIKCNQNTPAGKSASAANGKTFATFPGMIYGSLLSTANSLQLLPFSWRLIETVEWSYACSLFNFDRSDITFERPIIAFL